MAGTICGLRTMTRKTVYLLRHGAIELPHDRTMVGQIDLPLSAEGTQQAGWWRQAVACLPLDKIYCSDLIRSYRTAQIVAGVREKIIQVVPELREINLGAWDGLTRDAIRERFPAEWAQRQQDVIAHRPPGGESFLDLRARVVPVFDNLIQNLTGNILIAGHAGVNRVILSTILGMPLANIFRLKVDYGSLSTIEVVKDEEMIAAMNVIPALEGDQGEILFQKRAFSGGPDVCFDTSRIPGG